MSIDPRPAPPRRCKNCGAPVYIADGQVLNNGGTFHVCAGRGTKRTRRPTSDGLPREDER